MFAKNISRVLLALTCVTSSLAVGQEKVVVIPMAGDTVTVKADSTFVVPGSWDCSVSESCQDVYELNVTEPTSALIVADNITGNSVVRLTLHAPGVDLGGINLISGTTDDVQCQGQDTTNTYDDIDMIVPGTYKLVMTRDWGSSAGFAGTYVLSLTANTTVSFVQQTVNDVNSLENDDGACPFP